MVKKLVWRSDHLIAEYFVLIINPTNGTSNLSTDRTVVDPEGVQGVGSNTPPRPPFLNIL